MPQLLDLPPQIFQRGTNNPVLLYRVHHPRTPGTSIVPFEDAYWMNTDDEILSIVEHIEDGFYYTSPNLSLSFDLLWELYYIANQARQKATENLELSIVRNTFAIKDLYTPTLTNRNASFRPHFSGRPKGMSWLSFAKASSEVVVRYRIPAASILETFSLEELANLLPDSLWTSMEECFEQKKSYSDFAEECKTIVRCSSDEQLKEWNQWLESLWSLDVKPKGYIFATFPLRSMHTSIRNGIITPCVFEDSFLIAKALAEIKFAGVDKIMKLCSGTRCAKCSFIKRRRSVLGFPVVEADDDQLEAMLGGLSLG